ncbi:MAG: hypothetical protein TU35_001830 [Thermoproteus sp. AZ2]|jgi:hypothetical protein|uniref:Uncharacterized protein n=1 Tax=Thermoproteus sp. AZ2 TaxID=1609232 RepID=A0ACC6UZ16_9CREN|nr:MAG: hypothetical protein TU35_02580 [Thermoproteus sp. AZ2]
MGGIFFVGRDSGLRELAAALRGLGIKVVEVPGRDAVLYIYDEKRGGSIMLEGEDLVEYLRELNQPLDALSSSS